MRQTDIHRKSFKRNESRKRLRGEEHMNHGIRLLGQDSDYNYSRFPKKKTKTRKQVKLQ